MFERLSNSTRARCARGQEGERARRKPHPFLRWFASGPFTLLPQPAVPAGAASNSEHGDWEIRFLR